MNTQDFMNTLYDVLAQNQVGQGERDEITEVVDHVDLDRNAIVFKLSDGREFELQLVDTYAPAHTNPLLRHNGGDLYDIAAEEA